MVLLLVGIWVLVALLINPRGEFPLNDDWIYAKTVKTLLAGGGLHFADMYANIVAQIFWGALFCLPFGFSFTALRISTLTLGLIGVLALYGVLREAGADRNTALFGALLLAFNPLYMVLSYSFMSDVPFTAVCIVSLYFIMRGFRRNTHFEVAAGLSLACLALLIRQPGLAIFVGFALAYLAKSGWRPRNLFLAGISVMLGGTVQVLWDQWMRYKHILPPHHSEPAVWVLSPRSYLSWQTPGLLAFGLVAISVYLGIFLFPFLLFVGRRKLASLYRSPLLTSASLAFAVLPACELRYMRMPLLSNVLYNLGLGPAPETLRYTLTRGMPSLPTAGNTFWIVVTFLGGLGAVVLFQTTLVAIPRALNLRPFPAEKRASLVILLATGLTYLAPVAILTIDGRAFDRYLLFPVAVGIAMIGLLVSELGPSKADSSIMLLAVLSLALYGAFSVAGTHDYLCWNRARWQALNHLMNERRVPANDIDGGYEFNGWYLYDPKYRATPWKSYWWVAGDDFMITFGPAWGFTELSRYPFQRWLPPSEGNILVLRKTTHGTHR